MQRLCERPGCSTAAEVAYGFDAESLTVWLEAMATVQVVRHGVLCRRHADAMIVPLGWMLDDRREPTLRLFKSAPVEEAKPRARRPRRSRSDDTDQLTLLAEPEVETAAKADATAPVPAWVPVFDPNDDLKGLLKARGRLLSRAFRSTPMPPS
jgi:hypothetical protein